jgi:hypothetical protein
MKRNAPDDYDGIIAGGQLLTRLLTAGMLMQSVILNGGLCQRTSCRQSLRQCWLPATHDGVKDGLLTDPRQCQFDPAPLICKAPMRIPV